MKKKTEQARAVKGMSRERDIHPSNDSVIWEITRYNFAFFSSYMAEAKKTQQQQHNNECRPESLSPWRANDEGSAIQFLEYTSTARIVN